MKRILLLWPDEEELDLLKDVQRREITLAFRTPQGDIRNAGAVLFFHGDDGILLARVEPPNKTGELDYFLKFTETSPSPGWKISELRSVLSTLRSGPLERRGGVLGEKATARVLKYV